MDVTDKFVSLSIRKGSPLRSLAKNPEDLHTVLLAFLSSSDDPSHPTISDAQRFLSSAGEWISAEPEELLSAVLSQSLKTPKKIGIEELSEAVQFRREKLRRKKRQEALEREEQLRLSRIDRSRDEFFMQEALKEARLAAEANEVPIGALVVDPKGKIIGRAHNHVLHEQDPCGHAEVLALRQACKAVGHYRLDGCSVFVTLEPCPMCAGAILGARVARLVYAAPEEKTGAVESVFKLFDEKRLNHHTTVTSGVFKNESLELLRSFFGKLRNKQDKQ